MDRYGMLAYEVREHVAWATLDRPDKLNALPTRFWGDLRALLGDAEADDDVRVLVLRGAGKSFCAGGDIGGFGDLDTVPERRAYQEDALGALRDVERFGKPTVAAVHGHALGGGCELTMVCDLVVADETAVFGTPEVSVGLVPGLAAVRGSAHTGLHWLKYLVFTGETISAEEARHGGLVNVVTPPGGHVEEAARLAALIASRPPVALRVAKRLLGRDSHEGYEFSVEATALLHGTEDRAEGVDAFRDKRAPRFVGR